MSREWSYLIHEHNPCEFEGRHRGHYYKLQGDEAYRWCRGVADGDRRPVETVELDEESGL